METQQSPKARRKDRTVHPERVLVAGFLAIILIGACLLCLPAATQSRKSIGPLAALFEATSAVCVTGLVVVDTATTFSLFGQVVLLFLIQLGGLGFMVFATMLLYMTGHRLSLKNRLLLRESMNTSTMAGLGTVAKNMLLLVFGIELIGAALLSIRFIPMFGPQQGIFYSIFHAVSAFCNAGFDLMGNYNSLMGFANDPLVLLTIVGLIILGSLGFFVMMDLIKNRFKWKKISLQSRISLGMSGVLIFGGAILLCALEWNNPGTLGSEGIQSPWHKMLNGLMQSVTMRTAGFSSIDLLQMHDTSKLLCVFLMFIGASPASTGGGVKTSTMLLLLLYVNSIIYNREDVNIGKNRIAKQSIRKAICVVIIAFTIMVVTTFMLSLLEGGKFPLIDLLFESSSAIATVGVSAAGTPSFSLLSKAFLIPVMFFGRVGPLTIALALSSTSSTPNKIKLPETSIMIG